MGANYSRQKSPRENTIVRQLKKEGHTCIQISESKPHKVMFCGNWDKCNLSSSIQKNK